MDDNVIIDAIEGVAAQSVFKPLQDDQIKEGETVSFMHAASIRDPRLFELMTSLRKWVNTHTGDDKYTLETFEEDLSDGIIFVALLEKLSGVSLKHNAVAANETSRKENFAVVCKFLTTQLGLNPKGRWSVDGLLGRQLPEMLALLADVAIYYNASIELPANMEIVWVTKSRARGGVVETKTKKYALTFGAVEDAMIAEMRRKHTRRRPASDMRQIKTVNDGNEDAFDRMFDTDSEARELLYTDILAFCNRSLEPMKVTVSNLEKQFRDGTLFLFLLAILGKYFVQMSKYYLVPENSTQRLHNVTLFLDQFEDMGFNVKRMRASDIVAGDLKTTMRALALIYETYST